MSADETGASGVPAERAAAELTRQMSASLVPGLYLVATPIGNLGDITLRALAVLARADIIFCEDTRRSGVLLAHFGIRALTRPLHEHNEEEAAARVLAALAEGKRVALISDAGTPLISDPGFKLVREAAAAGHRVVAIPGASASLDALIASGLPTDAFHFVGFLPAKEVARRKRIEELSQIPGTLVIYEAPGRVADALGALSGGLGPRQAAVARELTKLHEEMVRGTLAELAETFAARDVKGEVVIVIAPPSAREEVTDEAIAQRLEDALTSMSLRDASKAVAEELGVAKARVYGIGLALKRTSGNE